MALSAKEQEMFDRLSKKKDAPDAPPISKSISANIDLSDEKQIKLAIKHGFLTEEEVEEMQEEEDEKKKEKKADATPRRRGSYFKDGSDEE